MVGGKIVPSDWKIIVACPVFMVRWLRMRLAAFLTTSMCVIATGAWYLRRECATNALKEVRCYVGDEGRSLGAGGQAQAPNHRKLRRSKAVVVSVTEKARLDLVRCVPERRAKANH
jgi:hypothetical protein